MIQTNIDHLHTEISKLLNLSDDEMNLFLSFFCKKKLKKGDYFLKKKEVSREIAFVDIGVLKYFYNEENQERILSFPKTSQITYSIQSYLTQTPSDFSIQAVVPTKLWVISKDDLELTYKLIPEIQSLVASIFQSQANFFSNRVMSLLTLTATERYQLLLTNNPEIIQNVSIKDLASFLNITPQHLSRLRRIASKNGALENQ